MKNIVVFFACIFLNGILLASSGDQTGFDLLRGGSQLSGASGASAERAAALLRASQTTPGSKDKSDQVEARLLEIIANQEQQLKELCEGLQAVHQKIDGEVAIRNQSTQDEKIKELKKEVESLRSELVRLYAQRSFCGCLIS